jgi:hypothetical protein
MMQESIRSPLWFALAWVEPTADPTVLSSLAGAMPRLANDPTVLLSVAGAPPKLAIALLPPATPQAPPQAPPWSPPPPLLPRGVTMKANSRGVAFFAPPRWVAGVIASADFSDLTAPQLSASRTTLSLSVVSLDGRFHPRIFGVSPPATLAAGAAAPVPVALWPSLQATAVGEAGAVALHLQWSTADARPTSWAVVSLACTLNSVAYSFVGQADVNGDVIVPLTGLPPTAPTPTPVTMTLNVLADFNQSRQSQGCDTDALLSLSPATVTQTGAAAAVSTLSIMRGTFNNAISLTLQAPQGAN